MRRYTFYLKDGRTATAAGVRLDPNVDRVFQGQMRNFVTVHDGEVETAVFLSGDVVGWTIDEPGAAPSGNGARRAERGEHDPIRAFLES